MLFIQNGKLTHQPNLKDLTGTLHLKDNTNLATIIGSFKAGICESADIYRNQKSMISNIHIEIKEDGSIRMGGSKVRQQKFRVIYKGGYSGYCRNGYGQHYIQENWMECGVWKFGKRTGSFVEEYRDNHSEKARIIDYQGPHAIQEIEIVIKHTTNIEPELVNKQEGEVKSRHRLDQEELQQWKVKIAAKKKQMQCLEAGLIIPLTHEISSRIQTLKLRQLKETNLLSFDQCQVYLQYLFHSEPFQSKEPTAILSIHTSNYMDKLYSISQDYKECRSEMNKEVNHILLQYKYQYRLFRKFWKHIIIPLAQYDLFRHFSFIRITIHQDWLQCVYYDSIPHSKNIEKMKVHYLEIAKKVLIHELIKDSRDEIKKQINKMTLKVFQGFPLQQNHDKHSCGFFILQGIADLMMHGKISFVSANLSSIKEQILQKFKEMSNQDDDDFQQNAI